MEQSEIFGVSKRDTMEYVDFQKKIRKIIESLTLHKVFEIGLDKREFYRLKNKLESDKLIVLRKRIWKRLNNFI